MQNKGQGLHCAQAQGAIEYLLIIGAAILVVAIVIIAVTGALSTGQTQVTEAHTEKLSNPLVKLKDDVQGFERVELTFTPGQENQFTLPLGSLEYHTLAEVFSNAPSGTQVLRASTQITYTKQPDLTWTPDATTVTIGDAESFIVTTPQQFTISVAGQGYTEQCQTNINFLGLIETMPICCNYYPLLPGCIEQGLSNFYKLDETSPAATFIDSNSARNGQCFDLNCPQSAQGMFGTNGQLFASTPQHDNYIQMLNTTNTTDRKMTYLIWFYPKEQNANTIISFIVSTDGAGKDPTTFMHGRGGIYITPEGNLYAFVMNYGPGSVCWENGFGVITTNKVNLNAWNMLAFEPDYTGATKGKLFLNGTISTSGTSQREAQCNNDSLILWLGRRKGYEIYMNGNVRQIKDFNGIIDEFTIWKRHLTDSEIIALWNNGNGRRVQ